jgi:hypothetical protein
VYEGFFFPTFLQTFVVRVLDGSHAKRSEIES